jgi:cytochrome b561
VMFPLLAAMLALAAARSPLALGMLAGGLAVGAGLALWALRLTRFERTADGLFYTPSAHIGIALSLLLAARIAWRLFELRTGAAAAGGTDFVRSPLTLAVFGTLAGYYAAYAVGLIRWRRSAARLEVE